MSIDLQSDHVVTFAEVPRLRCIPRRRQDRRLHVSTVYRWHLRGIRGIRLEAIRVGGTYCTSVEALQRFFERLAGDHAVHPVPSQTEQHDIDAKLDSLGILTPGKSARSVESVHPEMRGQ